MCGLHARTATSPCFVASIVPVTWSISPLAQVLAQGSVLQLLVGTLLSAAFLLFQVQASPYKEMSDDFLASASSFGLVVAFLVSTAFKYSVFTDLADIQDRMSIEQRSMYIVNQATLTIIMILSILGTLILSFILFLVQFIIEGRRSRREALASKARRLRYKINHKEVVAPELPSPSTLTAATFFHVFLSHVWGTGASFRHRFYRT